MLGKNEDSDLKNKLNSLKARITDAGSEQNDFVNKFNNLLYMANGNLRRVEASIVGS